MTKREIVVKPLLTFAIVAKIVGQSLQMLNDHPGNYRRYEAPNGWGTVDGAKTFLAECLVAFMTYPDAIVEDRD